jgi:hypothetical protein
MPDDVLRRRKLDRNFRRPRTLLLATAHGLLPSVAVVLGGPTKNAYQGRCNRRHCLRKFLFSKALDLVPSAEPRQLLAGGPPLFHAIQMKQAAVGVYMNKRVIDSKRAIGSEVPCVNDFSPAPISDGQCGAPLFQLLSKIALIAAISIGRITKNRRILCSAL